MENKVSIIIPIYNTERYRFEKCIQSVIRQTWKNWELLVVDDGSEQECTIFIDELCSVDDRIQVFHNKNHGVSYARNYGVKHAKGDWVTFIDADDYVSPVMLEHALIAAKKTGAAFVIGAVYVTNSYDEKKNYIKEVKTQRMSVREVDLLKRHQLDLSIKMFKNIDGGKITRGPISRLLRTELAQKHLFAESLEIGEDTIWNEEILEDNLQVALVKEIWYFYVQNACSVTHKCNPLIKAMVEKKMVMVEQKIIRIHPELQRNFDTLLCEEVTSSIINRFLLHPENRMNYREKKDFIQEMLDESTFNRLRKCPLYINKTGIKLFLLRYNLILLFYFIRRKLCHEN